ncbi:helix-turn-helix domain-containing protein [Marmoricola sp. URHB0036]|uniref:AraC-like ligand-binding domain-containing protein n=1 Tax=Marmoricola sp. URHB0036 TaxID=1298863 RepID=UPI0004263D87|nr:helix-turn-helix domain-containing protein [Marmoricola sp. URHB0036]
MTSSAASAGLLPQKPTAAPTAGAVLETVFSTDGLSTQERLMHFDAFLTDSNHGSRVLSRRPELFAAHVRAVQLGSIEVSELTAANATVARTPALIRASDPDVYAFIAPLSGRTVLSQAGRDLELRPGWMALRSSGRPFEVHIAPEHGPARLIRAQVPRSLLAQQRPQLDRMLAEAVPGHGGMGSVFTQFLAGLASAPAGPGGDYRPGDLLRLGNLTLDMFDAVVAHVLDSDRQVLPGPQGLLSRVVDHIRDHLGDPELSPDTIAAAHHISVSYLHRLFASQDLTVAATIRNQRLERARRDLVDPRFADLPIHRIAARWGFRDHATFTRAFRARHGVPPKALRVDVPTDHEAL